MPKFIFCYQKPEGGVVLWLCYVLHNALRGLCLIAIFDFNRNVLFPNGQKKIHLASYILNIWDISNTISRQGIARITRRKIGPDNTFDNQSCLIGVHIGSVKRDGLIHQRTANGMIAKANFDSLLRIFEAILAWFEKGYQQIGSAERWRT